jgi:hypothetical protein
MLSIKTYLDGNGCLIWNGALTKDGYGKCQNYYWAKQYKVSNAHQLSYKIAYGEYGRNLQINHKCNVRACCNHNHLYLGTQTDNMQDRQHFGNKVDYKGSKHPQAILNEADILGIRDAIDLGTKLKEIARIYNVHPATISSIKNKRIWRHVV